MAEKLQTFMIRPIKYVYSIIAAFSFPEYGIGFNGDLPWHISADLARFKKKTIHKAVVMGRKTWESLPEKYKPLSDRINIIITSNPEKPEYIALTKQYELSANPVLFTKWENLNELLNEYYDNKENVEEVVIECAKEVVFIGGGEIYRRALAEYDISLIYATEVYKNEKKDLTQFDTFFPTLKEITETYNYELNYYNVSNIMYDDKAGLYYRFYDLGNIRDVINSDYRRENNIIQGIYPSNYRFLNYNEQRYKSQEEQYLQIMRDIMERGIERDDRTGTGTISLFGTQQRYDLSNGEFPISTTKRIFFRAVFEELALYLSGRTDNGILQEKGIHIWDGNTSREFLDKRGLNDYPEGDMGETYGFNFRHFGGDYINCKTDYPPGLNGFDQVENLLHLLKTDPTSRRMLINLWNPATLHKAALPSCLMMYQFYVDTHAKKLNCQIYLRSSDYFLANNWNTCTGALLVHMICNLEDIDLTPGELIVITGDTHLYKTHLEQVNTNLGRKCYPAPKLIFTSGEKKDLRDYKFEDLRLIGYRCGAGIKAEMAV